MKNDWAYVLLCLIVPLVWGIVSSRIFDFWQARVHRSEVPPDIEEPEDMYHI